MKKLIPALAALFTLVILAGIALAQGDATPEENRNALTHVAEMAFQILIIILPIVAAWLTHKAISLFESKSKIDIPLSIEKQIDEWIYKGIHYAAEKSYQKVKEKTAKLTGPEKLETASGFVFALVEAQGWTQWTIEKIKAKIDAVIGVHRANGGVPGK